MWGWVGNVCVCNICKCVNMVWQCGCDFHLSLSLSCHLLSSPSLPHACILCWQCVVVPHAVVHIEGEQVTEYFDDLVKVEGAHTHTHTRTHLSSF